jgi:SMI1/KNR4 family protein SUKH-1
MFRRKRRMDLRTLLLGGGHQWDGNPPAAEDDIEALVSSSPAPLPSEYVALLRLSDGGQAQLSGYPSYVRIWSARTAIEYNRDYEVQQWLPGFVGFGDNGGPDMVGFDTRFGQPYRVCAIPFAPMEWEAAIGEVTDFSAFIRQLLPRHNSRMGQD